MRFILPDHHFPLPVTAARGSGVLWIILIVLTAGLSRNVQADLVQPFRVQNLNPFFSGAGLPPAESPFLGPHGRRTGYMQFDIVNNSVARSRDDESVIIDGETYRALFGFRYPLTERVELGGSIPWVTHSPGFLDNFIANWHEFFGLPNGERDVFAPGQLQYHHAAFGQRPIGLDQRSGGWGDAQLSATWRFAESTRQVAALRTTVDSATGEPEKLTGSGAREVAIDLVVGQRELFALPTTSAFASAGVLRSGSGGALADLRRDWVAFGSASVGWEFRRGFALTAQLDAHTSVFATDLTPLGGAGVQLTVGAQVQLFDTLRLDFAIGENLHTGATPDVVFHFAVAQNAW